MLASWKKSYDHPRQHIKKQRHYFANKGPCSQSYGFSSHVWMWELDYKVERWRIDSLELWCCGKTVESSLDCKEIKPANSKGNLSWIFIGKTDAEAEMPILGHLMQITDSLEKTLMLGNIESSKERVTTEDEVVGWHHQLDGHEFEQTLAIGDGQGSLACCCPLSHRVGTWLSNWTECCFSLG